MRANCNKSSPLSSADNRAAARSVRGWQFGGVPAFFAQYRDEIEPMTKFGWSLDLESSPVVLRGGLPLADLAELKTDFDES